MSGHKNGFISILLQFNSNPPSDYSASPSSGNFNPTIVQFKQLMSDPKAIQQANFNPTIVQFKRSHGPADLVALKRFQSYYSSIQTAVPMLAAKGMGINFNPTIVQFKRGSCIHESKRRMISILLQFNSNEDLAVNGYVPSLHFNPTIVQFKQCITSTCHQLQT